MNRKVTRDSNNKIIAGVCSGIANHFGFDPLILRLAWVFAVIFAGFGVLAYLICWVVIPEEYK